MTKDEEMTFRRVLAAIKERNWDTVSPKEKEILNILRQTFEDEKGIFDSSTIKSDGWASLPEFTKGKPAEPKTPKAPKTKEELGKRAYQLKIMLDEQKPPVWRRMILPAWATFEQFHRAIAISMDWSGMEPYEFYFKRKKARIAAASNKMTDEKVVKVDIDAAVCSVAEYLETENRCIYSYGSERKWCHTIVIEKHLANFRGEKPCVLRAKGNSPVEKFELLDNEELLSQEERSLQAELLNDLDEECEKLDMDLDTLNEMMNFIYDEEHWES